ncbi:16S rRNA (guanine(527)-N(7))-methyltransferase RsmG [Sulfurivirga sp.]|uniref:16S rRNA (guanine(527)-N(7))-methyltransferase RsmG n=1 Tax=Sulfurivirga sp. TaxID=2614236 RepID=UPI0025F03EE6|nr:16S rRNA (guanine(527)-N(7))-methyltransferase RsmG [Sulfurivirga sp.]
MNMAAARLDEGIDALGLEVTPGQRQKLLDYVALLHKWNRAYNLTAVRDPAEMVTRHVLDTLAVLPHLRGARWLDVGSGPGIPGLILAIMRPDWQVDTLDSNLKKTRFMRQAVRELGLDNAQVLKVRVEAWQPERCYEGVISRAFAELGALVRLTAHLPCEDGAWWAMKGHGEQELDDLPGDVRVERIIEITVPGLDARRTLVELRREAA